MAERRINRARLIGLLACVCVIAGLCGGFYAYRLHKIHASFLAMRDQGLRASQQGQSSLAVGLLGSYLARYPNDPDVLAAYALNCPLVELPNGENLGRAIWALRHLLRLEPDRLDARRQLMQLYVQTGYHTEALDEANTILSARIIAAADPSAQMELLALGLSSNPLDPPLSEPEIASIRPKLLALFLKYPDALDAAGVRTKSLLQRHEYPKALNVCDWWIDADRSNLDAALIRVELLQDNHRSIKEASSLAEEWIKDRAETTETADDNFLLAHTQLFYGQFNKETVDALILVADSKQELSSQPATRMLINDLDAIRQPERARAVLSRLLAKNPKDDSIRFDLIGRDWDFGDSTHLTEVVDLSSNLQSRAAIPTYVLGLRTAAMMMLGRAADSAKSLQELADRKDDREAAAWVILIRQSVDHHPDPIRARKAFQSALDQNPRDYYIRFFLADTYAKLGDREPAIHEWQRVTDEDRSWALPTIRLSQALVDAGRTEAALEAAKDAFVRSQSSDGRSHSRDATFALAEAWTANIQAGHKDGSDACLSVIDGLRTQFPNDGRPIALRCTVEASLGQTQQASQVVQRTLASADPLPEQAWIRLAALCETRQLSDADHPHLEQACLARCQKEHGITPTLAYAKAVAAPDSKTGLASFDADAAAAAQQPPSSQPAVAGDGQPTDLALGWDLARAGYLELIRNPAAAGAWARVADRNSSQLQVQRLVLSVQSVRADKDLSERCIERIGQLSGKDDSSWRAARARWLVDFAPFVDANKQPTAEATEARNLLNDLMIQAGDSVENRLLSAQAYERAGNLTDAINELQFASNLSPETVSIRLYLARLLETQGDFDAVQEQLDHLTDAELTGSDQRRQVASMFAQQGEMDRAIKLLEEDSATTKESETASLLLAELYQQHGDLPKAEAIVRQLLTDHPDPAVIRIAADLYASENRMGEALAVLDRLGKDVKTEPGAQELIRANFALTHERSAGADKAISLFEAATRAAPKNPLTWRGLAAVNLLANHPDRALAAADAGLRAIPGDPTLAAISGSPKMLTYAAGKAELQPLLSSFVNDPAAGPVAAETLNDIYSNFTSQEQTLDSLADLLRELAKKNPRFAPLQVYLINLLYQKLERTDDAIAVASAAEHAAPNSPSIAQETTQLLLAVKRYPEALASAKRWYDNSPKQRADATLAEAAALKGLGEPKEAQDLLKPLLDLYAKSGDVNAYAIVSQRYAGVLEDAGSKPDLAALMQPLLSRGAAGRLEWMLFAVNNLSATEAQGWLNTASQQMSDPASPQGVMEQVALADMYSRLANKTSDPDFAKIARTILLKLASMDRPPAAVLSALGLRLDSDGDWVGAAANYRRVLELQPNNVLAQNNLAMALARSGHASEGLPYIDAAIKTVPDAAEFYDSRSFVRSKAGDTNGALADMRQAARLSPMQARYHFKLVPMLVDANRRKDAADELKLLDSMRNTLSKEQAQQLDHLHTLVPVATIDGGT